ncbi:PaaI family thioesterase [Atribacter laminatus]|uniref:Esterase n=1 Tax=Atribacter laminatus TaxID=2847778 RepID=A0A7T1F343_ATRLM|nr:PaaI family thioesterase [Atribacter laminatus]QPM68417.1 Putative esterase [Atribacter laminatus]
MKTINPEHIKVILDIINQSPYLKLLSIKVSELQSGYCKVEVDLGKKHLNPFGGAHGGVYASLIDTATFCAVYCDLRENISLITIDLKVDNLSSAKEGKLVVEGKQIKVGRSICLSEATIKDIHGKLLAHGTSKQLILEGMQSISQAASIMGYQSLPPKFLS